ncbi:MAG TPA: hypothetical protein VGD40_06725 [Chryseosolibacter sp.]
MSTLNLKVLLNIASRSLGATVIIWLVTSFFGTAALAPTDVIGIPFYQILILSLVFSTPAFFIIAPALILRPALRTRLVKYVYVASVAILSCVAVIGFFLVVTNGYPLEVDVTLRILTPYVITALVVVPPSVYYFHRYN